MKPLQLSMTAFGPYTEKTDIDFTQLGDEGIYLVTGDTGAGKTTIFDAICFALFGNASISYRKVNSLRSDFADPSAKAQVEFTFSHRGREYTVKRTLTIKKKRNSERMEYDTAASLERENDTPLSGRNVVNEAISSILRLDSAQFKQIVMIAQGEFQKMLNATAGERAAILQKIFLTDGYQKMADILKEKAARAREDAQARAHSIAQYFAGIECGAGSAQAENLAALKEKYAPGSPVLAIDEMLDALDAILAEDEESTLRLAESIRAQEKAVEEKTKETALAKETNAKLARLEELTKQQQELAAQRPAMEEKKKHLEAMTKATRNVNPAFTLWKRAEAERQSQAKKREQQEAALGKASKAAQAAQKTAEQAETGKPEAEEKKQEAARLKEMEPQYAKSDEMKAAFQKAQKEQEQFLAQAKELENSWQKLGKSQRQCEQIIEDLADAPASLVGAKTKADALRESQARLSRLMDETLPALRAAYQKHRRAAKKFEDSRNAYDAAQSQYNAAEKTLENCRAGILAQTLKKGDPCPVCGSTEHPCYAALPEDSITEEQLKALAAQMEQARSKKDKDHQAATQEKANYDWQERNLRQEAGALFSLLAAQDQRLADIIAPVHAETAELKELSAGLRQAGEILAETLANAAKACAKHEAEAKKLQSMRLRRKETQEKLEKLTNTQNDLQQRMANSRENAAAAAAALRAMPPLPHASLAEAMAAREALEKASAKLLADIEDARKAADSAKQKETAALAALATGKETEKDMQEKAEAAEQDFRRKLREEGFASEAMFQDCCATEKDIRALSKTIEDYGNNVRTNAAQLDDAQKNAAGKQAADEKKLQEDLGRGQKELAMLRENAAAAQHRLDNNKKARGHLVQEGEANQELRKAWEMIENLHNLVAGKLSGKAKLTLEQYAQLAGFERIVAAANQRLSRMTGGQYELYPHKEQEASLPSSLALSLDVLDNFTGRKRPVSTLSGGESFKASLALALGLSDTISSSAGGITIDTLFIDEGFGTLDDQSLRDAIEMLMTLSANHKLIGLISHREELKEAISRKLIVTKTHRGSHVHVDTGQ